MVTTAQRITLLHGTTLFAGLDEPALVAIAERMQERSFGPGQTLFYEGDVGQSCFLIATGRVQVVKLVDATREIVLNEGHAGTIVGELALFGGQQRMATIRALEPTLALELSREALDVVIATYPQIVDGIVKILLLYLHHVLAHAPQMAPQALGGGEVIMAGVGQQLGQYQLEALLGQGGQSTVYLARDLQTGQEVALKVLSVELSQQPGFLERFRREAIICSGLSHRHILPVFSFGERGGVTYIACRLLRGGTLADRLGEPLEPERAAGYLDEMAAALDYAHGRGLVHLDVKPSNILLDEQERCYLADFGIAAMAGHRTTRLGGTGERREIFGTPSYLSPEQVRGEVPTVASDVYSLGVVLYEMVTGRVPFVGATARETALAHVRAPLPAPRRFNSALSPAAEAVLRRALAKQPGERFAHARELAQAWRAAVLEGAEPEEAPETRPVLVAAHDERTVALPAAVVRPRLRRLPRRRARRPQLGLSQLRRQFVRAQAERDQLRAALAEALDLLALLQRQMSGEQHREL